MRRRSNPHGWLVLAVLFGVACGGDEDAPAAGTPAAEPPPPTAGAPTEGAQAGDSVVADSQAGAETQLVRESFAYTGARRDPFASLLRSGDVRPFPQDLRVRVINFDPQYPQRSVVTVQDTAAGRRYTLRVGDQVGRVRVVEIRATEIVISIEEFGVERQQVLPIRRRQENVQ